MFICKKCVKDYNLKLPQELYSTSYGSCEDCHKVTVCLDVFHGHYYHKNSVVGERVKSGEITVNEAFV